MTVLESLTSDEKTQLREALQHEVLFQQDAYTNDVGEFGKDSNVAEFRLRMVKATKSLAKKVFAAI